MRYCVVMGSPDSSIYRRNLKEIQLLIDETTWFSQSEVVLLLNLQNLGEKKQRIVMRTAVECGP